MLRLASCDVFSMLEMRVFGINRTGFSRIVISLPLIGSKEQSFSPKSTESSAC
jgi:hypothetical protein